MAMVVRRAVQRLLEDMGIEYGNKLSPITIISLSIFGISICVLLWQTVLFGIIFPIRRHVRKLFSVGEEDCLETLGTITDKVTQKKTISKAKNTKSKKKKATSSSTTTSRKQEDKEPGAPPEQQPGVSLKALKRMEKETKRKKSDAVSGMKQHESNLFLETINSKHHTDEVTGLSLCGSYMVTACKDREIRVFAVAAIEEGSSSISSAKKAPSSSLVAHHIVRSGVYDVVCLEVEEQRNAMLVAFITYGPYTTVEVHTARISVDPKHPSIDILDKAPKIFAPKIDFDPLLLTGSSTRLVAASKKPRVAALDVANESLQSLKNIDTNSIINNDVAVSSDGSIVCVATFSSDVPVFGLPEGKKLTSLSGHKKRVTGVAISPDGTRVATASDDLTLRLWNIDVRHHLEEDPVCLARVGLPCATGLAHMAWVGPNSIAGVAGHDVYIFDASTGKVQHSILQAHAATITCLEPLLESAVVEGVFATGGEDGLVRLWKVPSQLNETKQPSV